jgi:hypothetical protein
MKATELRLGNWIYNNNVEYQVTPYVIEELWASVRGWVQPIPLTKEWLLKFGFKKSDNYGNDEYRLDGYSYFRGSFYISDCDECGESVEINFVHELQNLYFALTKKELTIM